MVLPPKNISRRFQKELLLCSPTFISLIIQLFCKLPQLCKKHSILSLYQTSKNEKMVSWARGNSNYLASASPEIPCAGVCYSFCFVSSLEGDRSFL